MKLRSICVAYTSQAIGYEEDVISTGQEILMGSETLEHVVLRVLPFVNPSDLPGKYTQHTTYLIGNAGSSQAGQRLYYYASSDRLNAHFAE